MIELVSSAPNRKEKQTKTICFYNRSVWLLHMALSTLRGAGSNDKAWLLERCNFTNIGRDGSWLRIHKVELRIHKVELMMTPDSRP